ncbi:MAG: hypothetical protein R3C19_22975 [Planctomycetaceae bacterium]
MSSTDASTGAGNSQSGDSEKRELVLDITQFVLDIVGIFEPTPFADGSNALISVGRGDWWGAVLSAASILPYVGDFAKLGKIPKYSRTIRRAIELAKSDAKFADEIRPALKKLKSLLDDVPVGSLPDGLRQIRDDLGRFLKGSSSVSGPVTRAMQSLPGNLKAGFLQAMQLPPLKNPRQLRKRPGPVAEDSLLAELAKKGFVQIKSGTHSAKKTTENSDIYIRRVVDGGKQYFEAIRVDRKFGGGVTQRFSKTKSGLPVSPGDIQRQASGFRRTHNTLGSTSTRAGVAQGGGRTMSPADHNRMVNELQQGAGKGEFSHWHHERIPATPEKLAQYLQKPVKGTMKFDNVGQLVETW